MDLLRVASGEIADSAGRRVLLKGTCVGGWMNMENFISGYPGTESGIRDALRDALGAGKAELFLNSMLDNFLASDDLAFIKGTGATVVRLPFNYRHFEDDQAPFKYLETGFARLDEAIDLCEKHGLYAILDLHAVQGWQNHGWHSDNDSSHTYLWTHPHFQDRFIELWKRIADRYRNRWVVAGYNVVNEPASNAWRGEFVGPDSRRWDWTKINAVYRRVVSAIREVDPDHIIFLEGDHYSQIFDGLDAPFADNLVYSSHNYTSIGFGPGPYPGVRDGQEWDLAAQKAAFDKQEGAIFARRHRVPLWVGEFGSVYNGPAGEVEDRLRAMDDQLTTFDDFGAHWTTWTYKDVGVMGWVTLDPQSDYMQLIAPHLETKLKLGVDDWMSWMPASAPGRLLQQASDLVLGVMADDGVDHDVVSHQLKQRALSDYVGTLLQPSYARLFMGLNEDRLEQIARSFAFSNCQVNDGLVAMLERHMAGPSM